MPLTPKEQRRIARQRFQRSRKAEVGYIRKLRKVAEQIGAIIEVVCA